jgi:hypothetical protein
MTKQLNIRSDEAYERAHRLAKRYHTTAAEAVVRALREMDDEPPNVPTYDDLTPEQRADVDRFMDLARRARAEMTNPEFTDRDLYDEFGLPK